MAKNEVKLKVRVTEDGNLEVIGKKAKKAAKGIDDVGRSSQTADRNLKGAAGASSNTTKNFSKMAQGITGGLVPAYATLAANVFAISAAFNFLRNVSDLSNLIEGQVQYGNSTGLALQTVTKGLREASGGMLGFREAAQAAAIGVAKGFSPAQMEELAVGARKVSQALGRNFEDSFDRLVRGISKAEPELLDELGITLRLETATENYAAAIGKTANALTSAERSQAVFIETQRQLQTQFKDFEGTTNPFVELAKTFEDIVNAVTQFLAPVFEKVAKIINENGMVAVAFFGVIAAGIIRSMPFVDQLKEGMQDFAERQHTALEQAKADLEAYRKKVESTKTSLMKTQTKGAAGVQRGAQGLVEAGATSPTLTAAAAGTMTGRDRANLKKALLAAEKDYQQHGKITKGIFKGVSISIVRDMDKSFKKMTTSSSSFADKLRNVLPRAIGKVNVQLKRVELIGTKAFNAVAKTATVAGKAMNTAMKATVILGVVQMIYDAFMAIVNAPATVVKNIDKMINLIFTGLKHLANLAIRLFNKIIDNINKIPGIDVERLGLIETESNLSILQGALGDFFTELEGFEKGRQQVLAFKDALDSVRDVAKTSGKELENILKGVRDREISGDLVQAGLQRATAIGSINTSGQLNDLLYGLEPEQQKQVLEEYIKEVGPLLTELSPRLAELVKEGNTSGIAILERLALDFTAGTNSLKEGIRELPTQISADNLLGAEIYLTKLSEAATALDLQGEQLKIASNAKETFDAVFKDAGGTEAFKNELISIREGLDANRTSLNELNKDKLELGMLPPNLKQEQQERLQLLEQENTLERLNLNLRAEQAALAIATAPEEQVRRQQAIEGLKEQIALEQDKYTQNKKQFSDLAEMGMTLGNTLESSLNQAFTGIIQGTTNLKDAFANLAKNVLQSLAQVIAKLLVTKILMSALGGTTFGNFIGVPTPPVTAAKGGVFSEGRKMYATGGIAKGPRAGYPAILHGTEAVVPLPDGKSIPVSMSGAAGQQNNVTVNVAIDNQGRTTSSTEQDSTQAGSIGTMIAKAVQTELQNQKRSGGILNPYGVA